MVLTYKQVRKRLQKKWWIEIRSKGNQVSSQTGLLKEAQDPNDGFVIYGEPKNLVGTKTKRAQSPVNIGPTEGSTRLLYHDQRSHSDHCQYPAGL